MKYSHILLLALFYACLPLRQPSHGLSIKGKVTVQVFTEKSSGENSIVQGYVYSRKDSCFLEHANITIDEKAGIGVVSDSCGFFTHEIKPGSYAIECFMVGHVPEKTKEIRIEKGQRIMIIFELGTDLV